MSIIDFLTATRLSKLTQIMPAGAEDSQTGDYIKDTSDPG